MKNIDFYNFVYSFHIPIIFGIFVCSMVLGGIMNNLSFMIIGWVIAIILCIFCGFYLYHPSKKEILMYFRINKKYILNDEEKKLWDSISNKAQNGYREWDAKEDKYNYMGAWMSPHLTKEEQKLIDKIHEYYYPGDYIVDPIGAAQADYVWYSDIKDKVKL